MGEGWNVVVAGLLDFGRPVCQVCVYFRGCGVFYFGCCVPGEFFTEFGPVGFVYLFTRLNRDGNWIGSNFCDDWDVV